MKALGISLLIGVVLLFIADKVFYKLQKKLCGEI